MAAELRARKKDETTAGKPSSSPEDDKKLGAPKKKSSRICLKIFLVLVSLIAATLATSYIVTNTFTFGYKIPNLRKYLPRKEIVLTAAELAQYDGSDPTKPIYLAINGKIFDVSGAPNYYGKGGGYGFFSGKDATRAYITGMNETTISSYSPVRFEAQMNELNGWVEFYENHDIYFYVGRVINDPIPEDAPIPEDCNQG
ncbi:hypothetical protein HDU97_001740 [Phlyctochytrium planicorne]|nr:hypothetical protein HDU97_001740 [Phlyctochytrium planicorne]